MKKTRKKRKKAVLIPNPGSATALKRGCLCPVIDNHYGHGFMGNDNVFIRMTACPLHGAIVPRRSR